MSVKPKFQTVLKTAATKTDIFSAMKGEKTETKRTINARTKKKKNKTEIDTQTGRVFQHNGDQIR
jgi:hypothetical protein